VYGFKELGPNGYKDWFESIEEMAKYIQSIVKVNPNGPYAIAGFSFGGIVALKLRQLKEQGKKVSNCVIRLVRRFLFITSHSKKSFVRLKDRSYRRLDYFISDVNELESQMRKKVYLQQKYFGLEIVMTEQGRRTCEIYRS
jgi:thioesterase domain-containing protein